MAEKIEAPSGRAQVVMLQRLPPVVCRVCGRKWDSLSPCAPCFASGRNAS